MKTSKKVIDWIGIILLVIVLLLLCGCYKCEYYKCKCGWVYENSYEYCPNCGSCRVVNHYDYYQDSGDSDYFSGATLYGQWQMLNDGNTDQAYMNGCGIIPKGIKFGKLPVGDFGRCTMTYCVGNDPQWYEVDLEYNYVRRELTFYGRNSANKRIKLFSFTYRDFLFPTLTVQDSFGTYKWNKVR